jgi:hypothetical protein
MKKILVISALLAVTSFTSFAQRHQQSHRSYRPSNRDDDRRQVYLINDLQREVKQHINYGMERKLLTRKEAKFLIREYEQIEARERHLNRDGYISSREASQLINDLQLLKQRVQRESRDFQRGNDRWARRY